MRPATSNSCRNVGLILSLGCFHLPDIHCLVLDSHAVCKCRDSRVPLPYELKRASSREMVCECGDLRCRIDEVEFGRTALIVQSLGARAAGYIPEAHGSFDAMRNGES